MPKPEQRSARATKEPSPPLNKPGLFSVQNKLARCPWSLSRNSVVGKNAAWLSGCDRSGFLPLFLVLGSLGRTVPSRDRRAGMSIDTRCDRRSRHHCDPLRDDHGGAGSPFGHSLLV